MGCQFNFGKIEFASETVTAFIRGVSGRIGKVDWKERRRILIFLVLVLIIMIQMPAANIYTITKFTIVMNDYFVRWYHLMFQR